MRKIGINNFQLPAGNAGTANSGRLLWGRELEELKYVTSGKVLKIALRAVERAERYDCGHPFWNALADGYMKIGRRIEALSSVFPGITRVIHNSEVKQGDVLVSDFKTGLNYGFMGGGTEPVGVRVLEVDDDLVKGEVLSPGNNAGGEIGYFKNELWFFISHRFTVFSSGRMTQR